MYYGKKPSAKAIAMRCGLEIFLALLITIPLLYIYVFVQGEVEATHRGFFSDDQSLKYPNVKERITNHQCLALWGILSLIIISLVEILHNAVFSSKSNSDLPKFLSAVPRVLFEIYRSLGYLYIGGLFTLSATELAKHQALKAEYPLDPRLTHLLSSAIVNNTKNLAFPSILYWSGSCMKTIDVIRVGRLRPYFLTVCQPQYSDGSPLDFTRSQEFVLNYTCTGEEVKVIREARKSFISGHTSFSFFCATYLIVYLQTRLYHKPDYKHHPTDVLGGVALGSLVAVTVTLFLLNLREHPSVFLAVTHYEKDQIDHERDPKDLQDEEFSKL